MLLIFINTVGKATYGRHTLNDLCETELKAWDIEEQSNH